MEKYVRGNILHCAAKVSCSQQRRSLAQSSAAYGHAGERVYFECSALGSTFACRPNPIFQHSLHQ